ncbi:Collagen alpha-6(VI) chain [Bagarius yarrelli]|uniref:Collagen alpha-6(VI) chain n=1 Tax=Bagarius yarrelli TaxID=175774 RepID=A0A556V4Z9_BAGYA|nr:Collagen alpha-6(VI) chain [Bagarius yarrelli]
MGSRHGLFFMFVISSFLVSGHGQKVVCTQESKADIVFLVDGSASIGLKNFQQIREFLSSVVMNFDIAPNKVRVGMVQFSDTPKTEFSLNTYEEKQEILDYIKRLPYKTGGTNTGEALQFLLKNHFTEKAGSRANEMVPQIAFVITDGNSQDEVEPYAQELRQKGIQVYAIGIKEADEKFLKKLASQPYENHVYSVSDFNALQEISLSVSRELCITVEEAQGERQECTEITAADIVLLVDSSDTIGDAKLKEIQSFLHTFVNGLEIGQQKVRVGLAQFSNNPHQEFLFGVNEVTKEDLLRRLLSISRLNGGPKRMGLALDFIRNNYFSQARQNVSKIAIVITEGESSDAVQVPAQELRRQGVVVFVIETGPTNNAQLQAIANSPQKRISSSLKYSDVFLLVDSTASKPETQQIKTFLTRLVNQLAIDKDGNHVGLAQFSNSVDEEFLLDNNKTRNEILTSIRTLRLKPKGVRQTGQAIEYARKNFFNTSTGSRIAQGFKQVLLVTSVGKSNDGVIRPSRTVKMDGIRVISVGLGKADIDELDDISSPNQTYKMTMPNISQVIQKVKSVIDTQGELSVSQDCKSANIADIVFIVDKSGNMGPENFQLVRTFLLNIISGLDVGIDKIRISIVHYSDVPRADVYLNTFIDKSTLLQYVQRLSYGRGKAYTGAALRFAKDQVFTKERGSRSDEHVQQIAVVITDGWSADDVTDPAAELRRSGVTVFAIGIKNVNAASSQRKQTSIFFFDESGSISYEDFDEMKAFILEFLHMFEVGPNRVRIGVVKFASHATTVFRLDTYNTKSEVEKAVKDLIMDGGGTRIDLGLEAMIPLFKQASQTREEKVREILIMITDGKADEGGTPVKIPAEELRKENITIYAIGVKDAGMAELEEVSGSPKRTFYVQNYDALKLIKTKVLKEICSFEACEDLSAEVVFLIDGGDAVDGLDFNRTKELIGFAVEKLPVKEDRVRLSVVQYSTNTIVEFTLNAFHDKDTLQKEIASIQQVKGNSHTGRALQDVLTVFQESSEERAYTLQFLIVVTDSVSKDDVAQPARDLRERNINIYAIGFGHASKSQLFAISGSYERVYLDNNFASLQTLGSEVIFKICNTECKRPELMDVIFLVDGSGGADSANFQLMKKFLQAVVKKADVGQRRVRFGTIIYSDQAKSEFTLNQYINKDKVLKAISGMHSPGGRRNTAQALKSALSYFAAVHGGRRSQHVPQVLCLITDGPVADSAGLTKWPEDLLGSEVNMFAIGMAGASEAELTRITGNTERAFYVDNYDAFKMLYKPISQQLCNLTKPVCEKESADLVILIDGSESISEENWEVVKGSAINIVKKLEIAPDKWRVSVAQFSDKVLSHFYLDKYTDLAGVEQGIHEISQRKQGTNTWKALKEIGNYFTPEHGSRIKQHVSQNLLLITDGKANDAEDPNTLANLRAKNIKIFAIGIGHDINHYELIKITGSKERVFYETFESLPQKITANKVLEAICIPDLIPDPKGCSIDIGIGFDASLQTSSESLLGPHTEPIVAAAIHRLSMIGALCCVAVDKIETKFGFRLVSGKEGKVLDDFRFKKYDPNVVTKVLQIRPETPTAFNTLLLNSFQEKFAGSKAGVKVVVLFTDGFDDSMEDLKASAESLRQSGVNALVIVALKNKMDYQALEFGRGFSYNKPLSINMLNVGTALLEQIGRPGQMGPSGIPGDDGPMGERGKQGLNGTQGNQGCLGSRGLKGSIGYTGNRGEEGDFGLTGVDGQQGEPGATGAAGLKGDPGRSGAKGVKGGSGPKGEHGVRGDSGSRGVDSNVQGPKGEPGYAGRPGDQGPDGAPGKPGEHGQDGFPGKKGPPGAQGITSTEQGGTGPEGPAGQPGSPGLPGRNGAKGEKGDQGLPGVLGLYGPVGAKGAKGNPGRRGPRGSKGSPGSSVKTECELVNYVRENCGHAQCPGYPTELVIALDMSNDVTSPVFNKIRSTAVSLLEDIAFAETNCPVGARVSVVSYNSQTSYLIRFSDHSRKSQLLEAVKGISLQRSRNRRNMGQAMLFVADNMFKRVRNGKLVRKVAIFLTNGDSQDITAINTAMLKLKASNINLGVITFNDAPNIRRAIQADETGSFKVFTENEDRRIKDCVICFDQCNPDQSCRINLNPEPEEVDVDLTIMMDSSYDLQADQYSGVKEFLVSVLDVIDVSSEPTKEDGKARIGVYQQSSIYPKFHVKEVLGLGAFTDRAVMERHISEDMQQAGGSSSLDSALEWTVTNVILEAPAQRKKRMVLNILGEESRSFMDKEEMKYIANLAQCNDILMVTLTVGEKFSWSQVEGLTTPPMVQHHIPLGQLGLRDRQYAQKYLRALLRMLTRDFFPKPSSLNSECSTFVRRQIGHAPVVPPTKQHEDMTTQPFTETFTEASADIYPDTIPPHPEVFTETYTEVFTETYTEVFTEPPEMYTEIVTDVYQTYTETDTEVFTDLYEDVYQNEYRDQPAKKDAEVVKKCFPLARCSLAMDMGRVCSNYESRWYYDSSAQKCKHFWYGGCDGNDNRFLTETECEEMCSGLHNVLRDEPSKAEDVCQLPQDTGACFNFMLKWHYDASQRECSRFWYGGCEGNGNRFDTQEECESRCLKAKKKKHQSLI